MFTHLIDNRRFRVNILCCCLLMGVLSCGKKDATTDYNDADANFESLWTNVFSDRCGTCHGVTSNSNTLGGPDMRSKESFYTNLVNKTGADYPNWDALQINRADCLSYAFIKPGQAQQSLVVAVFDSSVAPCIVKSHLTPPQSLGISAGSLTSLKSWISNGAGR
jgi:hypothetical protein